MADGEPIECCTEEGDFVDPETLPLEERVLCFPIQIPRSDRALGGDRKCINFVRSVTAPRLDCQPSPLEQVTISILDHLISYSYIVQVPNIFPFRSTKSLIGWTVPMFTDLWTMSQLP